MPEKAENSRNDTVDRLLPPSRELALEHALTGMPWGEIARAVGVGARTLYEWRQDPLWRSELRRMQRERREAVSRLVESDLPENVRVLRELRDNLDTPAPTRRACALDLLALAGVPVASGGSLPQEEPAPVSREAVAEWVRSKATEQA